ncbi:surface antigen [Cystoisospora suis]|uniref:Surface antigen n=1 Tax=Cystoisospora suis TaxID=483139 RepID=A0A2C6KXB3_9APIC|nr:surface antigen [Cystoisospora suis]
MKGSSTFTRSVFCSLFLLLLSINLVVGATVKDIICPQREEDKGETVTLKPGESFSFHCGSIYTTAVPTDFVTNACSGTGATCAANGGVPYKDLFPKASGHTWVQPTDLSLTTSHTWTAPAKGDLDKTATVFSVGCTSSGGKKCYVDVTVSASYSAYQLSAGIVLFLSSLTIYQSM